MKFISGVVSVVCMKSSSLIKYEYNKRKPVLIVQGARWASGLIWTGTKNLAVTVVPSPGRPSRSEMLYRLTYPGAEN
jgi:hypothetical protein